MDIQELLNNQYLTIPIFMWFIIQTYKVLHDLIVKKKLNLKRIVGAGGMPSSHSAFVCSFATVTAIKDGFGSPLFAFSVLFACVVMYDAAGVRRAAGKQARVLNQLIQNDGSLNVQEKLIEFLGHSPIEVFVGALIGIVFTYIII